MTGPVTAAGNGGEETRQDSEGLPEGSGQGPVIRDRRRLDPQTGRVREAYAGASGPSGSGVTAGPGAGAGAGGAAGAGSAPAAGAGAPAGTAESGADSVVAGEDGEQDPLAAAVALAEERLADLQRLQAEFLNYKRRVERDRDLARMQAVAAVLEALLPVLDDIHAARQHGDLEGGPFASIADKLEATLSRFGLIRYGEPGELFDPTVHEALLHTDAELAEGTPDTTVVQVLQPGYRTGDKVLRAARVAVADPR